MRNEVDALLESALASAELFRGCDQRSRRSVGIPVEPMAEQPGAAADAEFDYGRHSSADLNGIDHDATRRRNQEGERGA